MGQLACRLHFGLLHRATLQRDNLERVLAETPPRDLPGKKRLCWKLTAKRDIVELHEHCGVDPFGTPSSQQTNMKPQRIVVEIILQTAYGNTEDPPGPPEPEREQCDSRTLVHLLHQDNRDLALQRPLTRPIEKGMPGKPVARCLANAMPHGLHR
jgi:hypothetical protein